MKFKNKKIFSALILCLVLFISPIFASAQITSNEIGTHDGYDYEFWKDQGGWGNMTLGSGGTFSGEWGGVNNILFRKGQKFDETQTHQQLGHISINYGANYQPNGNSYLGVYGWTTSPLVEFYIIDSWGTWRPPGGTSKGTIQVDGGTYEIYETTRTNEPSIIGDTTFQQYWSVRTEKRTSGTISVSDHFHAWESMGMPLGNMYEVATVVEGWQSSGSAEVYSNTLSIGGSGGGSTPPPSNGGGGSSTVVQAEDMNVGGPWAHRISSPFDGVVLYGNDDRVFYNQYFASDTHSFSLRGASNNNNLASVDLRIGGQTVGTFYFGDNYPAVYTIDNVRHGTGNQEIELILTSNDGNWDAHVDFLEIH